MAAPFILTDEVIENQSLSLDLGLFVRCNFKNCELVYNGAGEADFQDCTFENCTWTFDRAAQRTISFLAALQHHTGSEGPKLVKGIFDSIVNSPIVRIHLEDHEHLSAEESFSVKRTVAS